MVTFTSVVNTESHGALGHRLHPLRLATPPPEKPTTDACNDADYQNHADYNDRYLRLCRVAPGLRMCFAVSIGAIR